MEKELMKLGIGIWVFSTILICFGIIYEYFPYLYEVYNGHSPLLNNIPLNIYLFMFWSFSTLKYFLKYFINLHIINHRYEIFVLIKMILLILGIIFFLIYLSTYNQFVHYSNVSISEVFFFNFPWVYFFISWLISSWVESELLDIK
jgi:hypothetical protein